MTASGNATMMERESLQLYCEFSTGVSCEHCEIFGIWPRRSATLLKRDSNTLVFYEYCEVSFYRTPPLAASENIMV